MTKYETVKSIGIIIIAVCSILIAFTYWSNKYEISKYYILNKRNGTLYLHNETWIIDKRMDKLIIKLELNIPKDSHIAIDSIKK